MTTTLILWFVYVAYLVLRSYTGREEGGARAAAVLGIVGFVDVPINYMSITWWRTQHPAPQIPLGGQPQAPASVVSTLMFALLAFTLLYISCSCKYTGLRSFGHRRSTFGRNSNQHKGAIQMVGPGTGYLVAAYLVCWVGFFGYLGWIALRMRGVRTELETLRELAAERLKYDEQAGDQ